MSNKVLDLLIESLETEEWDVCTYTIRNFKRSIEIWDANIPILNTNVRHPSSIRLNLYEKYKLYKAVQKAKERNLLKKLEYKI